MNESGLDATFIIGFVTLLGVLLSAAVSLIAIFKTSRDNGVRAGEQNIKIDRLEEAFESQQEDIQEVKEAQHAANLAMAKLEGTLTTDLVAFKSEVTTELKSINRELKRLNDANDKKKG